MISRLSLVALSAVLVQAQLASAAPGMLDLIPDDAQGALAIRSLAELKKKGDRFLTDSETDPNFRLSKLAAELLSNVGVKDGVDEARPGAFLIVHNKYTTRPKDRWFPIFRCAVAAIPITDADKMGANFDLKAGELKPGKILKAKDGLLIAVRDKHVLLGMEEATIKSVIESKPLAKVLPAERARSLEKSDVLLYVSPIGEVGEVWQEAIKSLAERLGRDAPGIDPAIRRQFVDSLAGLERLFVTARIDDGLHLSALATYPKEVPAGARQFLARLQGSGSSDLAGLPDGPAIVATATRGDGTETSPALKLLLLLLADMSPDVTRLPFLAQQLDPSQRLTMFGVAGEVWKQLQGHRAAIYRNADPTRHGQFSLVAILDSDKAERFLGEIKQLARFAGAAAIDLSDKPEAKEDVRAVRQLIRDLDSNRFPVRESATTKLELIGEPVAPFLEEVLRTKPPLEVRRRVETIQARIAAAAKERRKGLLSDATKRIQPSFSYVVKAETRESVPVDVLNIKLADRDIPAAGQFRYLFGPQWDKVRVAVVGKQVVILWGSDADLLSTTLRNVKDGKPGLAAGKAPASFGRAADPARRIEFHLSARSILSFLKADDLKAPKAEASLMSLGLAVKPDSVRLDLSLPVAEIKAINQSIKAAQQRQN